MGERPEPMWVPVMRTLLDRIVGGKYPEGSIIPSETELGAEFGVSRTVLRESVKVLTEKGLLSTWRGLGTRVEPMSRWRNFDPELLSARLRLRDGEVVIRELLILRKAIEPILATMAAERCDEPQLARLGTRFHELERHRDDHEGYVRADAAFHAEIAEIAGVGLAQEVFRLIKEPIDLARQRTIVIPGALEVAHAQHERIFRCIRDRDPAGASAAMFEHMTWNEERLNYVG
jgi:DNA-binding FadR family transcriptional regulator